MAWYLTLDGDSYEDAYERFTWDTPDVFNAAHDLVGKHDDADRPALYYQDRDGTEREFSFGELDDRSNQVARALRDRGIGTGDRVAICLPQHPTALVTHLACWKLGAISVPLSVLLGQAAVEHRLGDCEARLAVVPAGTDVDFSSVSCLDSVYRVETDSTSGGEFQRVVDDYSPADVSVTTERTDPAIILYTSGSTGKPKGVLHTHEFWVGNCPAMWMYFEHGFEEGTVGWTPVDWSWTGALATLIFPMWHYGYPVAARQTPEFDPEDVFGLLEQFGVTNAMIPPTALRMMQRVDRPAENYDLSLEVVVVSGEKVTGDIFEWADQELPGVTINEMYGMTEASGLVSNCQQWFESKPGSMGKPVPGQSVAVVDPETFEEVPPRETGEIAVDRSRSQAVFEQYWNAPDDTAEATTGNWFLTGDLATVDADGYYWFENRADNLILSSGYRIAPQDVEETILQHPDVSNVGIVGVPDDVRGTILKAFVKPASTVDGDRLETEITDLVREDLAAYQYPREIEFVEELPTTSSGKIDREALEEDA